MEDTQYNYNLAMIEFCWTSTMKISSLEIGKFSWLDSDFAVLDEH